MKMECLGPPPTKGNVFMELDERIRSLADRIRKGEEIL